MADLRRDKGASWCGDTTLDARSPCGTTGTPSTRIVRHCVDSVRGYESYRRDPRRRRFHSRNSAASAARSAVSVPSGRGVRCTTSHDGTAHTRRLADYRLITAAQLDQAATRHDATGSRSNCAAVLATVVVEAEPADYHHQPCRELAASIGSERSQSPAAVD